jgi:hypothetical protein
VRKKKPKFGIYHNCLHKLVSYVHKLDTWNILKDQQMQFGLIDVILLHSGHWHVAATQVAIIKVMRPRIKFSWKCV